MRLIHAITVLSLVACGAEHPRPNRNVSIAKEKQQLETYNEDATARNQASASGSIFSLLCSQLEQTDLRTTPTSADLDYLCTDGQPTSLLANKLPSIAYSEGGEVRLLQLTLPEHDNAAKTTSMTVATAARLPTSAEQYFAMMTALMDDSGRSVALDVELIDGQTKNDTIEEFSSTSDLHVKGWKKHVRVETEVSDQLVISEYINRQDHWVLQQGRAYVINSYLEESIEGVLDGRLTTILVQGSSTAYLIAVIHTKTDNRGLPSVAQDQLITKYKDGIRNSVTNAVKVRNERP